MTPAHVVAANLRRLRMERDWTQKKLSERSGVSQPAISVIASGGTLPAPPTLRKLAAALGVDAAEFRRPLSCRNCRGVVPRGFTCQGCGAMGDPPEVTR
jgi:transcriptional regulator with XRE-family HTH domain